MAEQSFDLIVIGTGSAGASTAKKCAKEGWNVAIIDFRPFGGTCPLRGCDPKKVLVGAAGMADQTRRMQGNGIASAAAINWADLIDFKRTFTKPVPRATEDDFEEAGITYFHGKASFIDEQTLSVNSKQIRGDKILIASGNKPAPLPIDGFDLLTTSDEFLELEELPQKIVFAGGGYISFEFAHIAARTGAETEILHQLDRPLKNFDADLVDVLMKKTQELGIKVHLNTEVQSVEKVSDGFQTAAQKNGDSVAITSDLVVHGAGRVPEIDKLNLENGHIEAVNKGVKVNSFLQSTTNEHVYAAGDASASDGLPLTPLAGFESTIVTANILNGNQRKAEYPVQPSAVFTIPPLAAVGLTESQARDTGKNINVKFKQTEHWYSSRRINESHSAFKTVVDEDTNELLGAHILGRHAAELVNFFALAINQKIKTDELKKMLYAYPTHGSNIPAMV